MRALRGVIFCGLLIVGLGWFLGATLVTADTFEIAEIWGKPEAISASAPSLNDAGQIAYLGQSLSGGRTDIYLYDGTGTRNITSSSPVNPQPYLSPSLNNQGQIAFWGTDNSTWHSGIYLYDGNRINNITISLNISPFALVLNDKGQIAYVSYDSALNQTALYLYDQGTIKNITADSDINPSGHIGMNNNGHIVFMGYDPKTDQESMYWYDGDSVSEITLENIYISDSALPSVNDQGQIAFVGVDSFFRNRVFLYDREKVTNFAAQSNIALNPSFLDINNQGQIALVSYDYTIGYSSIYLYDGASINNIPIPSKVYNTHVSLNNEGHIAFSGSAVASPLSDIYLYDGFVISSITQNISITSTGIKINNKGEILFSAYDSLLLQSDIYLHSAGSISNLTKGLDLWVSSPSMNDSDQIVFVGESQEVGRRDIYLYFGNAFTNITADTGIKNVSSLTINNQGEIVFVGENGDGSRQDIYLYSAKNLTNISRSLDTSNVFFPSINNQGQITFIGQNNDYTRSDIYLFANDILTNLTYGLDISSVYFMSQLNDAGQLAFYATGTVRIASPPGILLSNTPHIIYFFDGRVIHNITPPGANADGYFITPSFSLNNKGQIAFFAYSPLYFGVSVAFDSIPINRWEDPGYFRLYPGEPYRGISQPTPFSTSLYFYNGYQVETIKQWDFPPYYSGTFTPSLNEVGQIVFHNGYVLYLVSRTNSRPIAKVNAKQLVQSGADVGLDGAASFDPDNDTFSYYWSLVSKPQDSQVVLSDPESINPSLTPDLEGVYEVQLMVNDGKEEGTPGGSIIIVQQSTDPMPLAYAGRDQSVATNSFIKLDGSNSYNPGEDTLTYHWSLIAKPSDSQITIAEPGSKTPSFRPDRDGLYRVALVVENSQGKSPPDVITIVSLGKDYRIHVALQETVSSGGHSIELLAWAGNAIGEAWVIADTFIGIAFPDGRLFFLDPSHNLISSDPEDPRTFTPFAQSITLSPGRVFPSPIMMDTDLDGNGKLDSYRLLSITLPDDLPAGEYYAFAAISDSGSSRSGEREIIGKISLSSSIFFHEQ